MALGLKWLEKEVQKSGNSELMDFFKKECGELGFLDKDGNIPDDGSDMEITPEMIAQAKANIDAENARWEEDNTPLTPEEIKETMKELNWEE